VEDSLAGVTVDAAVEALGALDDALASARTDPHRTDDARRATLTALAGGATVPDSVAAGARTALGDR
jgi:hypothetical protein